MVPVISICLYGGMVHVIADHTGGATGTLRVEINGCGYVIWLLEYILFKNNYDTKAEPQSKTTAYCSKTYRTSTKTSNEPRHEKTCFAICE